MPMKATEYFDSSIRSRLALNEQYPRGDSYLVHDDLRHYEQCHLQRIGQQPQTIQDYPAGLVSVRTLDLKYQKVFHFPYFNTIQSQAFDSVINSDSSVVVSSPTGSGKTAVFELAIIKLLKDKDEGKIQKPKIIYMAPVKALCSEKHSDWSLKFASYRVKCVELTGDSDTTLPETLSCIDQHEALVMLTTPEKWDSLTRKWRSYGSLITSVNLFLIDEVHLLNEDQRGPTLEVIVSRMKTVRMFAKQKGPHLRFVACSATIPNASDVASWLGMGAEDDHPALLFQTREDQRPVQLEKIILGYPFTSGTSLFKFDLSMNYKIPDLLSKYCEGKPTLIFCTTRKGVQQTAVFLAKTLHANIIQEEAKMKLNQAVYMVQDIKIQETLAKGVGFHHAGLSMNDRRVIEQLFLTGFLPVLVSTSTLALGVNLPAHLVIIKSTTQMVAGSNGQEYSSAQILQMIGRAGRPQFDKTATAIIMTQSSLKDHYENVLKGASPIESCLHLCLKEHLNAEIVLETIKDVSMAVSWLRTTFLYVRAMKHPSKYGIKISNSVDQFQLRSKVEQYLFDLCVRELNALNKLGLIVMEDMDVVPAETGKLMARYYIAFNTMSLFSKIGPKESLGDLLEVISSASEFSDIQLRVNERKSLNQLNKDKSKVTIRFPMQGRITSRQMKINCLIQAVLGCLPITDPTLAQETSKILRLAYRISKCLAEYLSFQCMSSKEGMKALAQSFINALIITKCLKCQIWENSLFISKQIEKIGIVLSRNLVDCGFTTFDIIGAAHPRDLERALNRAAPFGNRLVRLVHSLPRYALLVQQTANYHSQSAQLSFQVELTNYEDLLENGLTTSNDHAVILVVADAANRVLFKVLIRDRDILTSYGMNFNLKVNRAAEGDDLHFHIISESWVGLDLASVFTPFYSGNHPRSKLIRAASIELGRQKRIDPPKPDSPEEDLFKDFDQFFDDAVARIENGEQQPAQNPTGKTHESRKSRPSSNKVDENLQPRAKIAKRKSAPVTQRQTSVAVVENTVEEPSTSDANFIIDLENIEYSLGINNAPVVPNTIEDDCVHLERNSRKRDSSQIQSPVPECQGTEDFEEPKSKEFCFDFEF